MEDSPTPASMDSSTLEEIAASSYSRFVWAMRSIRKDFPLEENKTWAFDEETNLVREISLPQMSWERFEEPNDELS